MADRPIAAWRIATCLTCTCLALLVGHGQSKQLPLHRGIMLPCGVCPSTCVAARLVRLLPPLCRRPHPSLGGGHHGHCALLLVHCARFVSLLICARPSLPCSSSRFGRAAQRGQALRACACAAVQSTGHESALGILG